MLEHMTDGQHQTISQDVTSAENVSFIALTRARQKLKSSQSVIAAAE